MSVYKGRLLKKSSNRKSKLVLSTLVTTWFSNIAFHLLPIWLQTLVAIDSESRLTSFPSFCALPSQLILKLLRCSIRIWADALSSDRSSIQTCCFAQDSIWNMWICSYVIFLVRDQWLIEDWAKQWARPWSATASRQFHRNFISHKKKIEANRGTQIRKSNQELLVIFYYFTRVY